MWKKSLPRKRKASEQSKAAGVGSSATKEYCCLLCGDLYQDSPEEDWIQCSKCKHWCHEKCSDYAGHDFVWNLCVED
ncbi:unnamed protein product [Clavelina lepadiformis]|uniref:Uncharacterized protein n=1 Tax=Clavelina lepadiformis TaxID=159417 RepID=A0ABP0F4K2_CLALP